MRTRLAAAVLALGLGATACGSHAPSSATRPTSSRTPTASPTPVTAGWVRISDPSGASFMFPAATKPTLTKSGSSTTRTYIAPSGGPTVVSVVIIPTPVALNVQNFFTEYPRKLSAGGATHVRPGPVTPLVMQGSKGFQTELRYDSAPGPSHVFEVREALQLPKYFVVISTIALDARSLTAAEVARARAVNTALLEGFVAK